MSLNNILKEMETNRPNAEMDVTLGNEATYGGRMGLKRAATEALKRLKLDYRNELRKSVAFILVSGSEANAFSQLASTPPFECFSTDPEEFYKDLVSRISPTLFGREGSRQLFNIAGNILEDKMGELDVDSYPMLQFSEKYNRSVDKAEDFQAVIKSAVNDMVGSEVVGINAINSIVDTAIKKGHSAPVTPLVLATSDENFALDLQQDLKRLTPKVFLVVAGKASKSLKSVEGTVLVKTVSEQTVAEALSQIKNKLL